MANRKTGKEYRSRRRKSPARVIFGWIAFIIIFLVLLFAMVPLVGASMRVTDGAMSPSLNIGDSVAVNHIAYLLFRPKRGDVVQFGSSGRSQDGGEGETMYIRRVIGLPGETVQIMDGAVYINGYPLEESYAAGAISYGGIASAQLTLDNDEYFVMADNRSNNFDSRDSTVGPIVRSSIRGKVWLKILPIDQIGMVK